MVFLLVGCGGNNETEPSDTKNDSNMNEESQQEKESDSTEHASMDHSSSGEVPENLAKEDNPTYPLGSEAIMSAKHMKGMDGAVATIEGAYHTTVYAVTYKPTTGGEKVENHKWVIHEELENAEEAPYAEGDEVVLEADHMNGMDGANATIDSAQNTTVYMVSYKDTETKKVVKNHKWVTEGELSPVE